MSDLAVRAFVAGDAERWDALVSSAWNGTFLHTRRFLSYHGDRFEDVSTVVLHGADQIVGLFPAAVSPADAKVVVSHPGATFGGLVHAGGLRGERGVEALDRLAAYYGQRGFSALEYRAVPYAYHRHPSQDDLYALFRCGAERQRAELASTIDLSQPLQLRPNRRREAGKASGDDDIVVVEGESILVPLWALLESSLKVRHSAEPVHSLPEIRDLFARFPEEIEFHAAEIRGEVVAGLVLFKSHAVVHLQYTAANDAARQAGALTMLLLRAIEQARAKGVRFFDLGTSNENEGRTLNRDLHFFKSSFGAGGMVLERFRLLL